MFEYLYPAAAFVVGFIVAAFVFRSQKPLPVEPPKPAALPDPHASGLFMLAMLQREGRFVDFLLEDVGGASDEQVGAAARVVHEGCRKVVKQYLDIEPVLKQEEGATVDVPVGFDSNRIRLTGNVTGSPPFKGALKHHGWAARDVKLPVPSAALDPKILCPAEVELP